MGKNLPKVTLPALESKGKYLQFALALEEQTKEFINPATKEFEGDKNKLLQLVKNAMVVNEDKKMVGDMYELNEAIEYLNERYNSDGDLCNSSFIYLNKLNSPKDIKESYNQALEIQHILKVIIKLNIEDRITRITLDNIIDKSYTGAGKHKFRETLASAQLRTDEEGKFADKWLREQAGEESHPAPDHDLSFSAVPEAELFKTYASGKITTATNTGTLLERIKNKSSALVLMEELKFFFYYNSRNLKVLARGVDQINERAPKRKT